MTMVLKVVFWVCIGAITYSYVGYPILLFLFTLITRAKSKLVFLFNSNAPQRLAMSTYQPSVAILISAFNEEAVIQARVNNALAADYPPHLLEVLIGLDSPTDSTAEILRGIRSDRIRVFGFPVRRGKLAVLRDLAQQTSAEVLVLTDAETMFAPDCVQNLVRHFADSSVGVVGGELRIVGANGTTPVEGLYWRYELYLKSLESELNCVLGVVGAVYAVRRPLFRFRKPSIGEDFQLPMEIRYAGGRVLYEPEAIAVEDIAPTFAAEFRRRVRIGAADYQILCGNPEFLNPFKGLTAFAYFSHKVLRWLGPLFLLTALVCSLCLVSNNLYAGLFVAQSAFYTLPCYAYWRKKRGESVGILSLPLHFSAMNCALFLGFLRYLSGRQEMAWEVTPRAMTAKSNLQNEELPVLHGSENAR